MKRPGRRRRRVRNIVALALLAVVCVGTAELVACRICDPALFAELTAPVRRGAAAAGRLARQGAEAVGRAVRAVGDWLSGPPEEPEEIQVSAPAEPPEPLEPLPPEPAEEEAAEAALPELQLAGAPALFAALEPVDPAVASLKTVDGREVLSGSGFQTVYYNQGQEPWASAPYGRDTIRGYGCGPTAMAMVVSSMTDEPVDPAAMAQWAAEQGHWAPQSGSYLSIVEDAAAAYGLTASSASHYTTESVRDAILSGKLFVALMGPGHFTQNGHFIVLRGITLNGELLVADPNSTERSLTAWDPQLILDELSSSTQNGGPLWVISRPESAIS